MALVKLIEVEGAGLVEAMGMRQTLQDLKQRLANPIECSTHGKLTRSILKKAGIKNPMRLSGDEFNSLSEKFYREDLRIQHITEAYDLLEKDYRKVDNCHIWQDSRFSGILKRTLGNKSVTDFFISRRNDVLTESLFADDLKRMISLTLLALDRDIRLAC